jgi:hypothetical protein
VQVAEGHQPSEGARSRGAERTVLLVDNICYQTTSTDRAGSLDGQENVGRARAVLTLVSGQSVKLVVRADWQTG